MDSDKCTALLTVLETGNIHTAASALGYSASGLSRMMAALEAELGMTLLVRSRTGVVPTDACQQLLPHIRRVAAAGDACRQAADALLGLETGTVRIGTAYPQYYEQLTPILADFRKAHPGIRISLREANSTPLAQALDAGQLDFAIMSHRPGAFIWHDLIEDELQAFLPHDHPLAAATSYPMERFQEDPYIEIGPGEGTDNYLAFRQCGIAPNICFTVGTDHTGYEMVETGLGVTLTNAVHARAYQGNVVALPTEPRMSVRIGIATALEDAASPAARAFTAFALPRFC